MAQVIGICIRCVSLLHVRNRLGENLGDCLDAWRYRSKDTNSFGQREARAYQSIMRLIRERLANRYVDWCRERRPMPSEDQLYGVAKVDKVKERRANSVAVLNRRMPDAGEESGESSGDAADGAIDELDNPVMDYLTTISAVKGKARR